ncbi:MAG: hypothetical protein E7440_00415 [Ruminococcaceae bacterium]|nr:hypothetical protein [Oscillospiraceae bacterium]
MSKRIRVTETLKTVAIVALTCCAFWLIRESQMFQVAGVLGTARPGAEGVQVQTVQSQNVLPIRMAVMSQGGCYAVQYDEQDLTGTFGRMAPLLNEALSSAQTPREITAEQWQKALTSAPGVYFDFQGELPLSVLAGWLSGQENIGLSAYARHLLLAADGEGGVILAYYEKESGAYFACPTPLVNLSHLQSAVAQTTPNGAVFACQAANYGMLAPWTIISAQTPQPREYAAHNPLPAQEEDGLNELLETLAFPLGITTVYETPEGRRARSGNDTLSVSNEGLVTYYSTREEERYPVTAGEGESELFAAVDGANRFVRSVLDLWRGEGRVCLEQVEEQGNGVYRMNFRYVLGDIPVQTGQRGYAATVLVDQGYITEFELQLRTYVPMEQTTLMLPQPQAAAALADLGQTGSQMELRYQDSGDIARAGWIAN